VLSHRSAAAHATLQKHDLRVLRVTDERFTNDPAGVLADIIALRRVAE
jgi:very-short-patch-repair endonuclease